MSTAAGSLQELHELHVERQDVQDELARGPMLIAARQRVVERLKSEIDEKRDQLKTLKMAADEKSLQLKVNEAKIAELKTKLNVVSSNREFDIFKSQIDADTMANSVLEDEILEVYEKVDEMQSAIAKAELRMESGAELEKQVSADVHEAEPKLQVKCRELDSALESAEKILPGSVMVDYRRLVGRHGAGALACVENKACSVCYSLYSANLIVEINVGKFVFCRNCGRLAYRSA